MKKNLNHDDQTEICLKNILDKFHNKSWKSPIINDSVYKVKTGTIFPSQDARIFINLNKTIDDGYSVGIEFKPSTETKRGMLTGLGQAIAYSQSEHASILISPKYLINSSNFMIGDYLKELILDTLGDKPIGLVTYNPKNFDDIDFELDPFIHYESKRTSVFNKNIKTINLQAPIELSNSESQYWSWWRDWGPHALVEYLIKIKKYSSLSGSQRTILAWEDYYKNKLTTPSMRNSLELVPSPIKNLGGENYKGLFGIKTNIKKALRGEKVSSKYKKIKTEQDGINFLKKQTSKGKDNNYADLKKNHDNTLNQLELWDEFKNVSIFGDKLIETFLKYGPGIELEEEFTKQMLIKGRWRNLVLDIEEFQKENLPNNNYASNIELREHLQEYFKSRGYVKTNINRSVTQKRKWLQAELQLLNKLGLRKLDEEKSKKVGFVFDFNKINKFSEAYYKEYKDDER